MGLSLVVCQTGGLGPSQTKRGEFGIALNRPSALSPLTDISPALFFTGLSPTTSAFSLLSWLARW